MAESTVRAPYNFVPFSSRILAYQGDAPAHNAADPELKTGEIHVTLTAETPVFVSDGNRDDPHFFRGVNGQFQLPGSTVRGMVRQNMQILGFGLVRPGEDLEDRRLFFRKVADARGSTGGELKDYYHNALGVEPKRSPSGKSYSVPQNVQSGYLCKTEEGYQILPTAGAYVKASKDVLASAGLEDRHAEFLPVYYTASQGFVRQIIRKDAGPRPEGMQEGVLLCPGLDTGGDGTRLDRRTGKPKPPSHRYVFPPADKEAVPVEISPEDALAYAADWEGRRNSLKAYYDEKFWKLPEEGEDPKPVFYIRYDQHDQPDRHVFFGMSLFLRIGYHFSLKDGLPNRHRDMNGQSDFLDYPRAILGYAEADRSRRSRVSFGDFPAAGSPKELPVVETVLGNPKTSYYPGYTVSGKHYNQEDFQLRGYKLYWLKEAEEAHTDKENVASKLRPLPAGTRFSGVIRYRNLRPEELGLLLWALRLEEDCFQTVGMGKPYGYGRMRLSIDELREFDLPALYSPDSLCGGAKAAPADAVQNYIRAYDAMASEALRLKKPKKCPSITGLEEIKDFFFLHRVLRNSGEVSYMDLREYQNIRNPLPAAGEIRKQQEAAEQGKQSEATDPYEALRNKFKKL